MIRSQSEQRSLYGSLAGGNSVSLNEKDVVIGRLRAQLRVGADSMFDYERLLEQREKMQQSILELTTVKNNLAKERQQECASMEKTAAVLRNELEKLRREMNSKTLQANDVLSEADSLNEFHKLRQDQLQQQMVREDELKESLDETLNECRRLEQLRRSMEEQLRGASEEHDRVRSQNDSILERLEDVKDVIEGYRLQAEQLEKMLSTYLQENKNLDREAVNILHEEEVKLVEKRRLEEELQAATVKITDLELTQQKLRKEISLKQEEIKQQRQRRAELQLMEKNMHQDRSTLAVHLEEQHHQTNFLLRRNGQIAQLNDQLKSDLHHCQKHFQTIRKTNEELEESVERFREQDENIVRRIESRGRSSTPDKKLTASRLTSVSSMSRLRAWPL